MRHLVLIALIVLSCGPGRGAEPVIDATVWSPIGEGLRFLAACQSADGRWDVDGYQRFDASGVAEPGIGDDTADVGVTAAVLLAFYGAGYDHVPPGPYDAVVARGLAWLCARQQADGRFPGSLRDQCLATMVLCDAKVNTNDGTLTGPAQRAIAALVAQQVQVPGTPSRGWGDPVRAVIDTRETAYAVLAVRGARGAGLEVGETLGGVRTWLLHAWRQANPAGGNAPASFPATVDLRNGGLVGSAPEAGLACALLLGAGNGTEIAHGLARTCVERWPAADQAMTDLEAAWLATLGIYTVDRASWKRWQAGGKASLLAAQCRAPAALRGSWDPTGQTFPGHQRGRLLSTALGVLANEVFMAYVIYKHDEPVREAFPEALHPGPDHGRAADE